MHSLGLRPSLEESLGARALFLPETLGLAARKPMSLLSAALLLWLCPGHLTLKGLSRIFVITPFSRPNSGSAETVAEGTGQAYTCILWNGPSPFAIPFPLPNLPSKHSQASGTGTTPQRLPFGFFWNSGKGLVFLIQCLLLFILEFWGETVGTPVLRDLPGG